VQARHSILMKRAAHLAVATDRRSRQPLYVHARGDRQQAILARNPRRAMPARGRLGRQRGQPAIELGDIDAALFVQRDQTHRSRAPGLPVRAARRAQDPRRVAAAHVGAKRHRQPPVQLLDDVQAHGVTQDPIGVPVPATARPHQNRRPRTKRCVRRDRLLAVAIDPHHTRVLDQITTAATATPTRDDTDKHIRPARQASDGVNDALELGDAMKPSPHPRRDGEAHLDQCTRRRRAIQHRHKPTRRPPEPQRPTRLPPRGTRSASLTTCRQRHTARGRPPEGQLTKQMAQRLLDAVLAEARRAVPQTAHGARHVTFGEASAEWLRYVEHDRKRRPTTLRDYRHVIAYDLDPTFGEIALVEITAAMINAYPGAPARRGAPGAPHD